MRDDDESTGAPTGPSEARLVAQERRAAYERRRWEAEVWAAELAAQRMNALHAQALRDDLARENCLDCVEKRG